MYQLILASVLVALELVHSGAAQGPVILETGSQLAEAVVVELTRKLTPDDPLATDDVIDEPFLESTIDLTDMSFMGLNVYTGEDFVTEYEDGTHTFSGELNFDSLILEGNMVYPGNSGPINGGFVLTLTGAELTVAGYLTVSTFDLSMLAEFGVPGEGEIEFSGLTPEQEEEIEQDVLITTLTDLMEVKLNELIVPVETCFNTDNVSVDDCSNDL